MELGMQIYQAIAQRQELIQIATIIQKLSIDLFQLKNELIEKMYGLRYQSFGICPECSRILTSHEILTGFVNDPVDTRTKCPRCSFLFKTELINRKDYGGVYLRYYCPLQVIESLKNMGLLTKGEMRIMNPSVYHSCLSHFGNLRMAYAEAGYKYKEVIKWKEDVFEFLGQLPDKVIAVVAGVSATTVRNYRSSLKIKPYKKIKLG
jgi:hypothetical protein